MGCQGFTLVAVPHMKKCLVFAVKSNRWHKHKYKQKGKERKLLKMRIRWFLKTITSERAALVGKLSVIEVEFWSLSNMFWCSIFGYIRCSNC